jgi:ABC-type nitrate/sulfonate/bicarbonate transport system substrate-binding protein
MDSKMGVKESLELVDLIFSLAFAIKEAKKDGIINWMDLPKFAPVIIAAKKAIDGSHLIDAELKDLSQEEAQLVATAALDAGQTLMEAIIKK